MCGIAGFVAAGDPVCARVLVAMNRLLSHRGPDGEGYLLVGGDGPRFHSPAGRVPLEEKPRLGLAHRRLAILDLTERGRQPMPYRDRLWITYNGEVYNYLELRAELEPLGYEFSTGTDTEVILAAYSRWGPSCLDRFNGMWGMAIYDHAAGTLFCARDRFGIKPLYHARRGRNFYFASEIKALLAALGRVEPDPQQVAAFGRTGRLEIGERTLFGGIERLRPGHSLTVDRDGQLRIDRWWRPRWSASDPGPAAAARRTRELLSNAVGLRLRSDVPVGTCLSGGLDSSSIVALACERRIDPVDTYSAVFVEPEADERGFVAAANRALRTRPVLAHPSLTALLADLPAILWHQDEPPRTPSVYPQWEVMRAAHGRVKVLLDGQGGDEILAGYPLYLPAFLRSLAAWAAGSPGRWPVALAELAAWSGWILSYNLAHLARPGRVLRKLAGRDSLGDRLLADVWDDAAGSPESDCISDLPEDPLNRKLVLTHERDILPVLLRYEDRMSMAFSIEARVPFVDHHLVGFLIGLPFHHKLSGGWTKRVLRRAMAGMLPSSILRRRDKKGYEIPWPRWLRTPAAALLRDFVAAPGPLGLVDPRRFEDLWRRHAAGADRGEEIWKGVALRGWEEIFFGSGDPGAAPGWRLEDFRRGLRPAAVPAPPSSPAR